MAARREAQLKGEYYEREFLNLLKQTGSLESARDRVHELMGSAPVLGATVVAVLLAAWLSGQYGGQEAVAMTGTSGEVDPFTLAPREAVQFFQKRQVVPKEDFYAHEDHYKAKVFTLSRISDRFACDRLHASLSKAIAEGGTFEDFLQEADAQVKRLGISGPGDWYWETVWRNNVQTAYNAGRYRQQLRTAKTRPYLRYVAVMDSATRPVHRALHNTIRPFDDPFWDTHYPPNGHRCRCITQGMSDKELEAQGLKITPPEEIPELSPDPGFKGSPKTQLEADKALIRLKRQGRSKGLLENTPDDLTRSNDPARVAKVDKALGLPRPRQQELLDQVGRLKTASTPPQSVPEGETWVEWSHYSQDGDTLELATTRLLQDVRGQKLAKRLELNTAAGAQASWRPAWTNPQVAFDQELLEGNVGKWTEFQLRARVKPNDARGMTEFWQEIGQLKGGGFRNPNPLPGAWDVMDLVMRGELGELPKGMKQAWLNHRQEGGVWVQALSRTPLADWIAEQVGVNTRLFEFLR